MRERSWTRRRGAALGALSCLLLAAPGSAQEDRQLDGGTFEHFVGASYAGTETFAVRRRGDDVIAVGRITREGGPGTLQSLEVGFRVDGLGRLVRYELHTREGPPLHVVVNRTGSRLRVTTASPEGERVTEFQAAGSLLVLETEIAHHYYELARLLREAAEPRDLALEALVPSEGRKVPVRVMALSRDTVSVGDAPVASTRYELRLGDETTYLWIATSNGRITRVATPDKRWTAVRQAME